MKDPTRVVADAWRIFMAQLARFLNKVTRGTLKPVHVTVVSFLGHIPAGWTLFNCRPVLAAGLITVFGLMDSLDGALAREQNSASRLGMFFDAVTDRLKEIIVYSGLIVYTTQHVTEVRPWVIVAAAGTSILVSYVKAKGEMALAHTKTDVQALNKAFDAGIARYEVRMGMVVIGLLVEEFLAPLLGLIVALNLLTAAMRFLEIGRQINVAEYKERHATKTRTAKKKT